MALARLEVNVSLVGKLGADDHARYLTDRFAEHGVDVPAARVELAISCSRTPKLTGRYRRFASRCMQVSGIAVPPEGTAEGDEGFMFTGTAIQIVTSKDGHKFGVSCTEARHVTRTTSCVASMHRARNGWRSQANGEVAEAEVQRVLAKLRPGKVSFAGAPPERTVPLLQLELQPLMGRRALLSTAWPS